MLFNKSPSEVIEEKGPVSSDELQRAVYVPSGVIGKVRARMNLFLQNTKVNYVQSLVFSKMTFNVSRTRNQIVFIPERDNGCKFDTLKRFEMRLRIGN